MMSAVKGILTDEYWMMNEGERVLGNNSCDQF